MNKYKKDSEFLMKGDWSKAFVALNQNDSSRLSTLRRRFFWLNLILPKKKIRNVLTGL
jgi:hypothetical protein